MLQTTSLLPNAGDVIGAKYRVLAEIGRGGMSVVLEAQHLELGETVAIKILLPEHASNIEASERFAREARAAAKIKNEHVAHVYDVGHLTSGLPFIVMERLRGGDLEQLIAERGPLGVDLTVDIMLQLADALEEAHGLGIVHRDLKPANLFISWDRQRRPILKLIDFGVSKTPMDAFDTSVTQAGYMFGSPDYMSPEQVMDSHNVDARGDIWALGVILVECLTKELPFKGETPQELFLEIVRGEPRLPTSFDGSLPPAVDEIVGRCLQRDPDARIQRVAEWARLLAELKADTRAAGPGYRSEPPTGLTSARTMPPLSGRAVPFKVRRLQLAAILLGAGAFALWLLFARLHTPIREQPSAAGAIRASSAPDSASVPRLIVERESRAVPGSGQAPEARGVASSAAPPRAHSASPKQAQAVPAKRAARAQGVQDDELFNEPR